MNILEMNRRALQILLVGVLLFPISPDFSSGIRTKLFLANSAYLNPATASEIKQAQAAEADWPRTKAEAVARLIEGLSEADRKKIKSLNKKELVKFHRGWGMGIRNSFGLWRGNKELMRSLGNEKMHPDLASAILIRAVWKELRYSGEDQDDFKRLDGFLADIIISDFSMNGRPIKAVVTHLNREINRYLTLNKMPADALKILMTENSNPKARVNRGFEKQANLGAVLDLIARGRENRYRYEFPDTIRLNYENSIYPEDVEPIAYFTEPWRGKEITVTSVRYGSGAQLKTDYFELIWTLPGEQPLMTVFEAFQLAQKALAESRKFSEIVFLRVERIIADGQNTWKYTIETADRSRGMVRNARDYYDMYYTSCLFDKRFSSGVTDNDFKKAPKWNNLEQAPPLDLTAAITAAQNALPLYTSRWAEMDCTRVQLNRYLDGDWLYEVTFEGLKTDFCRRNHIVFRVLLSGKVVNQKAESN